MRQETCTSDLFAPGILQVSNFDPITQIAVHLNWKHSHNQISFQWHSVRVCKNLCQAVHAIFCSHNHSNGLLRLHRVRAHRPFCVEGYSQEGICNTIVLSFDLNDLAIILWHKLHPPCLMSAQISLHLEVLQGFVVHIDVKACIQEIWSPFLQRSYDCEHLLFMDRVVQFSPFECHWVKWHRFCQFPWLTKR